jgi:hypothetical protein
MLVIGRIIRFFLRKKFENFYYKSNQNERKVEEADFAIIAADADN